MNTTTGFHQMLQGTGSNKPARAYAHYYGNCRFCVYSSFSRIREQLRLWVEMILKTGAKNGYHEHSNKESKYHG